MFNKEIIYLNGIPIRSQTMKIFFVVLFTWSIITYVVLGYLGFFDLFGTLFSSDLKILDEQQLLVIRFVFFFMIGHSSLMIWLIAHTESSRLTKVFFNIQRFSLIHMIISIKQIPLSDVFLLKNQTKWYEVTGIVFIGTWSLSFILNRFLHPFFLLPSSPYTAWNFLIDTSIFSVISYLLIFPIAILYSSNIRIKLKKKNTIITGFSIYKNAIISFFAINIIWATLSELKIPEQSFPTEYAYFALPIVLTCFFTLFSKKILTEEFRNKLKKQGVVENEIV
ncbi:MAG: hypothetical protein K8Q89_09580 [Nitrosarchaeum sp.]|nr:hypothetical protein [Nitrosarchaeum sp.]